MIASIRKFLLINLLLAITITTSLTALGDYYIDEQDVQYHLDMLLSHTAFAFAGLLTTELDKNDFQHIQIGLNKIPGLMRGLTKQQNAEAERLQTDYENKYQLQVFDNHGQLLLHTANSDLLPLANQPIGFSDKVIDNTLWRVFVIKNLYGNLKIVVAEKYDIRTALARRLTQDDIYIMLLIYPLSGLLIWLIIGKGLGSIKSVANEVSHRAPTHLEPVVIETVPVEIKPLVNELNQLFQRLQEAFQREKRFAGDAAHELRTPLAALKTQAQVALKTSDIVEQRKFLQNVVMGVDRCTHVVQQLLILSRLVPEAVGLEDTTKFDLSRLAAEIIAQIGHVALEKGLDIALIAEKPVFMIGNPTAIGILIRNLVDNAIRYTQEKGSIDVVVEAKPRGVLLSVSDNGPGIPEELHDRVFERFFRILGHKSPGSGLGLAIVQQIAKLHNAKITIGAPDSGQGLKVEVFFPRE